MKHALQVTLEALPHRHAAHRLRQTYALLEQGWHVRHPPGSPIGTVSGQPDHDQQLPAETILKEEER